MKIIVVLSMALLSFACAGPQIVEPDPFSRRVVIENRSEFSVNIKGAVRGTLEPGEKISANLPCYGRFKILATAYKVAGKDKYSNEILEYYGQRVFRFRLDGKNSVRRGEEADAFVFLRRFNYSRKAGRRDWISSAAVGCDPLLPLIEMEWKIRKKRR